MALFNIFLASSCWIVFMVQGKDCNVKHSKTGTEYPCTFPFVHKDEIFYGCTRFDDPDQKLWCSQDTYQGTYKHKVGSGRWGFCDNDYSCPKDDVFKQDNGLAFEITKELKRLEADVAVGSKECPCVDIHECQYSSNLLAKSRFTTDHPVRSQVITFIQDRICTQAGMVHCC